MGFYSFQAHNCQPTNLTNQCEELNCSNESRYDLNHALESPNGDVITCSHCGVDLSDSPNAPFLSNTERSLCLNNEMHIIWRCQDCHAVNTIEGDICQSCGMPRLWCCKYCTTLHNTARSCEGLRYCLTCENYNTPEDIFLGQATIDEEQAMAKRVETEYQVGEDTKITGSVVFGVNDSVTMLELQRQQEIEMNTYRLECRLKKLELKCSAQKDDGNCLFASLAHQLFGKAHLHHIIRSCIVAYMRENESDYKVFFNGENEWQQYVSDMRKSGFWGDEICINAAARCFCVDIHVITSDATRWHLVFRHNQLGSSKSKRHNKSPVYNTMDTIEIKSSSSSLQKDSSTTDSAVCLFLVYKSPVHFNDIEPSESICITLSDLLIPELYRLMQLENKKRSPKTQQFRVDNMPSTHAEHEWPGTRQACKKS
ncbi:unnamed protein product [Phytomonas sp. Hart1]|nr:unnamed protein product [Phytomonas sp. Hart1]|eukprot:CCW71954.1 unnamed protein product [Phytomonas sp. isolate Hart1]